MSYIITLNGNYIGSQVMSKEEVRKTESAGFTVSKGKRNYTDCIWIAYSATIGTTTDAVCQL